MKNHNNDKSLLNNKREEGDSIQIEGGSHKLSSKGDRIFRRRADSTSK